MLRKFFILYPAKNKVTIPLNKFFLLLFLIVLIEQSYAQNIIEYYEPVKADSLRVGLGDNDFMPFISRGYTLMLPDLEPIQGVLIFLEDSGYDKKNSNSEPLYSQASQKGFAILSVSTEIPFDFYFTDLSILSTHQFLEEVFVKYELPNDNVFFLGASLVGHRAMRYIQYTMKNPQDFQLEIKGIVICNFTMDWTRKWYQHKRDIRINRIDLWEPKFINYLLEKNLGGTPKTNPENYHNFSSYSYSDEKNENVKWNSCFICI